MEFEREKALAEREKRLRIVELDEAAKEYLIDNFAGGLGLSEIRVDNVHHFIDGLLAFRAFFGVIGYLDLVDRVEGYLETLGKYEPEYDYKSLPIYKDFDAQFITAGDVVYELYQKRKDF